VRLLSALLGLGVALAFVRLGPGQSMALGLAEQHLSALLIPLAWLLAATGAGAAFLKRWAPMSLDHPTGWAHALLAGLLLWGLGGLGLGLIGQLNTLGFSLLFALLAAGWLVRPALARPELGPAVSVLGGVIGLVLVLPALGPPIGTDALYTHVGLPAQMLMDGSLAGGLLHPQASRPLLVHLPYAAVLHAGGSSAPAVLHLLLGMALLGLLVQIGEHHLGKRSTGIAAALLLLGSWTFASELIRPGTDIVAALATLVALDAALRGQARGLALAAGTALSIKYTTAGALLGIFLVARLPWRSRVLAGIAAMSCLLPWWGRNLAQGLHPLFPFAGWPETSVPIAFQYLEKYGAGREALDLALLPWRVFMDAERDGFRFMGQLSPAFMVLLPFGLWASRGSDNTRRIAIASVLGALAWAAGPHWLRYLIPTLPLLALLGGASLLSRAPRVLIVSALGVGLIGLPANTLDVLQTAGDRAAVVTGEESATDYLSRKHHGYGAIQWANAHLPEDARVAMLFTWDGALLQRRQLIGSVEDHIPTRHWILQHSSNSLQALADAGATHALVRRARFLPNAYPFLSESERIEHLVQPVQILEEQLIMEADLLVQDGPLRLFRLAPTDSGS
jgi:hypothetical protein